MAAHATSRDSERLARTTRRRRLVVAIVGAGALIAGATTVTALTTRGAEDLSQGPGIQGSVEVGDFFGGSLAIGDFNGDGRGDLIAGAAFENFKRRADVGQIHVVYGTRNGLSTDTDGVIHQRTRGVRSKPEADDRWGSAVAVGDFNGDGYDDAVVGAPGEDTKRHVDAGGLTVLYGSANGLRASGSKTLTAASKGVAGRAEPHAELGHSLAVLGLREAEAAVRLRNLDPECAHLLEPIHHLVGDLAGSVDLGRVHLVHQEVLEVSIESPKLLTLRGLRVGVDPVQPQRPQEQLPHEAPSSPGLARILRELPRLLLRSVPGLHRVGHADPPLACEAAEAPPAE